MDTDSTNPGYHWVKRLAVQSASLERQKVEIIILIIQRMDPPETKTHWVVPDIVITIFNHTMSFLRYCNAL